MKSPASPRVVTLTLHPAIDRVVRIESMRPGGTFSGREELTVPAGKGVNTARVLRTLCGKQQPILAVVWAGEREADFFTTWLREKSDVECAVCPRPVRTRFAQTYLEPDGRETHIKESMPRPSGAESMAFLKFWRNTVRPGDIVALCGSAPEGIPRSLLTSIFAIAHANHAREIVVDTNGLALDAAAKSNVSLLKGNAAEIGVLLNCKSAFSFENPRHCKLLSDLRYKSAPQRVMITFGAKGATLSSLDERVQHFHAQIDSAQMNHAIVSTTGCGDAATAGAIWSLLRAGEGSREMLSRAVACGAAKTLSADPGKISLKYARRFVRYCLTTPFIAP